MKWIFLALLLVFTPALTALLRSRPQYRVHVCFVIGLIMYLGTRLITVAPISWRLWPDPVKGVEISLIDALAIALLLTAPPVRISLPIKVSFAFYCFAVLVASLAGLQFLPASFYMWQLARAAILFIAIARVNAVTPKAGEALLSGLGIGLMYEAGLVVLQFAHGVDRPGGTLGHSNFLGFTADFVLFPVLAWMLGSRRLLLPAATLFAGLIAAVLGGSRASMGIFAAGTILTVLLSIRHANTSRKSAFAGVLALCLLFSAPLMLWANSRRSEAQKKSSDGERAAMKQAARMIIADYPFGVGPNQYVIVANVGGYSDRAAVPWDKDDRQVPVHDAYYLVAAEMGFLGLIAFLALIASFIMLGFKLLARRLAGESGELVPGLLTSLLIVAAHNNFEFAFQESEVHYLFAIVGGMLVAIAARANALKRNAPLQQRMPLAPATNL